MLVPAASCSTTSSVTARVRVDHRRQRVVVGPHQLGGVGTLLGTLGDDGGDRLADVAHLVAGEDGRVMAGLTIGVPSGQVGAGRRRRR